MSFVHLHLHSEYSLLDGACRIKQLVSYAKELGQTAVAVTDHGCMYSAVEFYNEAVAQGIKPIIGCEVYVAPRTRFDKIHGQDNKPYHLVLLCKNNTGYQNLIKLVSYGYTEGFYNKPRIDIELLGKYHEGLIALSGCLAGEIPRKLANDEYESARATALQYLDIFGEGNYYIEIQNHNIPDEMRILPLLYRLSIETGIPLVATNDAHYITRQDSEVQRVLIAIQTNTLLSEPNPLSFPTNEFYIKSEHEMRELFANVPQAVDNSAKIAEMCNVTFEFGNIKLPKFTVEGVTDNTDYFRKLCYNGIKKRYGENPGPDIIGRMEYELDVISRMGYVDYFLIVWDFIRYAREQKIPVGPGRGSGAGSIAAYCIGITSVDPMQYNLLFERFLNPERVSMPDFDIDFCYEGRQKVIDYVVKKYGIDRVAQIITFGTMAAKGAIRDVGRVMGLSYQSVDKVSKLIPFGVSLENAMEESEELNTLYKSDNDIRKLIDTAKKLEGIPRHASTHAAGVVISDAPVNEYVPVQKNGEAIVTQYAKDELESLGLLKMDFLGLRNLTVIRDAENYIRTTIPEFDIGLVPLDDGKVYEMLSQGHTSGVFQFESAGMRQVLMRLKPESIEDLIAVLSLYRPGPMDSIPRYIECRHNPGKVSYKHPLLKNILDVTYGCIVYQEQVMEICRKLAGYSYGRADLVRRAMAKKKADVMLKERTVFIDGALKNGVPENIANDIFDEMSGFASYAFNKSHAAAYAYISYQTAFLKCHYYKEYMAALMTASLDNTGKILEYTEECTKNAVPVLPPDINESGIGFVPTAKGIRFALLAVKNLGFNSINDIIAERVKFGRFTSLEDFCRRMNGRDINQRAIESMIKCGAFDCFGHNRREMIENYDRIFSSIQAYSSRNMEGQINFFELDSGEDSSVSILPYEEYPLTEKLEMEKEILGTYISGHPLDSYRLYSGLLRTNSLAQISDEFSSLKDNSNVSLFCVIQNIKLYTQKNGAKMAFVTLEDMSGEAEGIVFADILAGNRNIIHKGRIVFINAKLSYKNDEAKLIIEQIFDAETYSERAVEKSLYIKCGSYEREKIQGIIDICSENPGNSKVILYLHDIRKTLSPKNIEGVKICDKLFNRLSAVVGSENIALKQ